MNTHKERTALDLIQLLLDVGCKKSNLNNAVQALTKIAYINSDFTDALFRAQNITESYNLIKNK